MTSREHLATALELIADELAEIRSALEHPRHGLAAIRTKLDMVTDDHDEALRRHAGRLTALERPKGNGAADAE